MTTFVFTKGGGDIISSVTLPLNAGENITNLVLSSPTPVSASPIVVSQLSAMADPILNFRATGGLPNTGYGVGVTVTTDQRVFVLTIAIQVMSDSFSPYKNEDPSSYQDLVGSLEAGKTALASTTFQFDTSLDPAGGYVLWDIMDAHGVVYASGNAYEYKLLYTGVLNIVYAKSLINVPSNIPPTVDNPYQLRYTLRVGNNVCYAYENLTVLGFPDVPVGAQDSIELFGDLATMSLVTDRLYANYVMEVYHQGNLLASMPIGNPTQVANGYFVAGTLNTTQLEVTLQPYSVIWKFWDNPARTFRESCNLWIINDSILQAVEDVKSKINKARQTLYGTEDSQFSSLEVMKWLRRGADAFNAAYGQFTNFTMTRALGPVREFWLMYAEKFALEAQYLMEGEKAFQFQGANINLDVDRTQYLDNIAGKIQSTLDAEVKSIKQNLIIKGHTRGDGSADSTLASAASMGAVGLSITPASIYNGSNYLNRF